MANNKKCHIELTTSTQIKITKLIVEDYQKQLKFHIKTKMSMEYDKYRHIYVRLHNTLKWYKAKLRELEEQNKDEQ